MFYMQDNEATDGIDGSSPHHRTALRLGYKTYSYLFVKPLV